MTTVKDVKQLVYSLYENKLHLSPDKACVGTEQTTNVV